jgi:hypothetical protein
MAENPQQIKTISIRFPRDLWRRIKLLEINGHARSISSLTLAAVEKEVQRLEKQNDQNSKEE